MSTIDNGFLLTLARAKIENTNSTYKNQNINYNKKKVNFQPNSITFSNPQHVHFTHSEKLAKIGGKSIETGSQEYGFWQKLRMEI